MDGSLNRLINGQSNNNVTDITLLTVHLTAIADTLNTAGNISAVADTVAAYNAALAAAQGTVLPAAFTALNEAQVAVAALPAPSTFITQLDTLNTTAHSLALGQVFTALSAMQVC